MPSASVWSDWHAPALFRGPGWPLGSTPMEWRRSSRMAAVAMRSEVLRWRMSVGGQFAGLHLLKIVEEISVFFD
jgi:hypothetical protein